MRNIILVSDTLTASGNSITFDLGDATQIAATLNVSAASGTTPTLDMKIEESVDGSIWTTLATFTQKTATGTEAIKVSNPFHNRIRATYTIGGTTPSFTASLKITTK